MGRKTWVFELEDDRHIVELEHDYWSGKRVIRVDGKLLEVSQKLLDTGSEHYFELNGHRCLLRIRISGFIPEYELFLDGRLVTGAGEKYYGGENVEKYIKEVGIKETMDDKSELKKSKGRIITGIVGSAVGLLSLVLPWIMFRGSLFRYEIISKEFTLFEIMDLASDPMPMLLIIILVLAGSIIAFASAWGGVIQLLSWVLFSYGVTSEMGREMIFGIHGLVEVSYSFQIGLFLAIIASIITLLGFAFRS